MPFKNLKVKRRRPKPASKIRRSAQLIVPPLSTEFARDLKYLRFSDYLQIIKKYANNQAFLPLFLQGFFALLEFLPERFPLFQPYLPQILN